MEPSGYDSDIHLIALKYAALTEQQCLPGSLTKNERRACVFIQHTMIRYVA